MTINNKEENLDNFLEGFIAFLDRLAGKKEEIEVAENCSGIIKDAIKESFDDIEWTDIDSITNLPIDDQATYYDAGGISTMDVIKAKLTEEQFKGFLLGNIIKYSCRLNHKDNPKRDSEKIAIYSKILSEL